ncbi:MAG: hypothetical protein IPN33_12520 [Saprospiraceae bacterium]|nr:hypothetical protein [Saprospiraceae bacterium]
MKVSAPSMITASTWLSAPSKNLQASGKTIGVISHVKALKERVSTQIQVKMKGNGFSEIAVCG